MKIAAAMPPPSPPSPHIGASGGEPAQTFTSLLDGPADLRQSDPQASFGFSELGLFGRQSRSAPASSPVLVTQSQPLDASALSRPRGADPADLRASEPSPFVAVGGLIIGSRPGPSLSPTPQRALAMAEGSRSVAAPSIQTSNLIAGNEPPEADEPRTTKYAPAEANADVSVLLFEQDGALHAAVVAPSLSPQAGERVRRLAKAAAEEAGLCLDTLSLNGARQPTTTIVTIGGHDGRRFG